MFTKGNRDEGRRQAPVPKTPAPKSPAPPSILSNDLKVVGDLVSSGEIQVDGIVEGDIQSDVLVVGETAQVNGIIVADTCRVHGRVTGQIRARAVSLAKTAHVLGDILHESLAIEQGAYLEAHCRRIEAGTGGKMDADGGINIPKGKVMAEAAPKRQEPAEAAAE